MQTDIPHAKAKTVAVKKVSALATQKSFHVSSLEKYKKTRQEGNDIQCKDTEILISAEFSQRLS